MRSSDIFGFFLLFLLDFWRPTEGLCTLENITTYCHDLEDIKYIDNYNLHSLKSSLKENILTPIFFQNLTTLKHLDLSKGNLKEITPGSFHQLAKLLTLNLGENHINHLNSSTLEGLINLQNLNLKKNNIHYLSEAFLDLKKLKYLDISKNQLNCNCSSLRVRDQLVERGVKISKRAICSGPVGVKGWSLLKPSSKVVCLFEEQDEGMQMDQPFHENAEGSGELGSGDKGSFGDYESDLEEDLDTSTKTTNVAETPVPETPSPNTSEGGISISQITETPVSEKSVEATQTSLKVEGSITPISPVEVSLEKSKLKEDDGLFFDTDEKSSTENSSHLQTEKSTKKNDLFLTEGSGDDGFEGSGTLVPPIDFGKLEDETVFVNNDKKEPDVTTSLFENIFGSWSDRTSTNVPEEETESEIEKEIYIPVVSVRTSETEELLTKKINPELNNHKSNSDKSFDIKENEIVINGETKEEIKNAASQETKMGNGSMVVLIVLLGIFVALVGLAAYKGDFCKKKRIPDDLERGTELKEMRKSLLDGGNSIQPKILNGNTENVPLINVPLHTESKEKEALNQNGNGTVDEIPLAKSDSSASELLDPVKPPRKSIIQEEMTKSVTNGNSNQEPYINPEPKFRAASLNLPLNDTKTPPNTPMTPIDFGRPPLSPDAQRVKIILQDNPDNVPRTPILITRTKMGENLVKTP